MAPPKVPEGKGKGAASGSSTEGADSGTVLGFTDMPKAEGIGGSLRRIVKAKDGSDRIFDFWSEVAGISALDLENLMKVAVQDSNYDMTAFIRAIEYQGFDRLFYIKHCLGKMSVSMFCRFAVLGSIRGSNFKRIVDTCEGVPQDMITTFSSIGFVKTPSKRTDITILRCTASIPHWCAYYLQKALVEKKITSSDCPAPIQFPGAASLPMSQSVRMQHIRFCVAFSSLLPGGAFKPTIYRTAMTNLIPVADIPNEILTVLGVSSNGESYKITDDDLKPFSAQMVVSK